MSTTIADITKVVKELVGAVALEREEIAAKFGILQGQIDQALTHLASQQAIPDGLLAEIRQTIADIRGLVTNPSPAIANVDNVLSVISSGPPFPVHEEDNTSTRGPIPATEEPVYETPVDPDATSADPSNTDNVIREKE